MHLIEIPEISFKKYIPEDLSECDKQQYINLSMLIFKYLNDQISYEDWRIHALYYLLKIEHSKKDTAIEEFKNSNIYEASKILDSFFETNEEDGTKTILQHYINNPIEKIQKSISSTIYGPNDEFNNVKFGEYVDALSHFADYHETGDIQFLYLLFATFYRSIKSLDKRTSKNYDGDKRIKYNSALVYENSIKYKQLPIGIIYGFYLLFASFQKYLTNAKLYVEGNEIDLSILFERQPNEPVMKSADIAGIGMKSIMFTISETGVFGNLDKVRDTSLWEILIRMYDIRKRDLDAQANQTKEK